MGFMAFWFNLLLIEVQTVFFLNNSPGRKSDSPLQESCFKTLTNLADVSSAFFVSLAQWYVYAVHVLWEQIQIHLY